MATIYKICPAPLWRTAEAEGVFRGSAADLADGYMHFSTAAQVGETARKHFAGIADLLLVAVDSERLPEPLRWEAARGGELFPHLYAPLPVAAVRSVVKLALGADGRHILPTLAA